MIIRNEDTTLTEAQEKALEQFDSYSEPDDKVEYSHTDYLNTEFGVPGELWIVLQRGIQWDNEQVLYVMDEAGKLEIL